MRLVSFLLELRRPKGYHSRPSAQIRGPFHHEGQLTAGKVVFRQNPRAAEQRSACLSHIGARTCSVSFTSGEPEGRARRLAKVIDQMLGRKPEPGNEEDFSETI